MHVCVLIVLHVYLYVYLFMCLTISLQISTGSACRPAILIDGGFHAREWISPATALRFIYEVSLGHQSEPVATLGWGEGVCGGGGGR